MKKLLYSECIFLMYWQQPKIQGVRAKHNQNVLATALISAMFGSGLLGRASMEHTI